MNNNPPRIKQEYGDKKKIGWDVGIYLFFKGIHKGRKKVAKGDALETPKACSFPQAFGAPSRETRR